MKPVDARKLVEALTPIRETTFEDYDEHEESQSEQVIKAMVAAAKERKAKEVVGFCIFLFVWGSVYRSMGNREWIVSATEL